MAEPETTRNGNPDLSAEKFVLEVSVHWHNMRSYEKEKVNFAALRKKLLITICFVCGHLYIEREI